MDVDYNPFRLQSMPCSLYLTHHESPTETTRYLIRPPRLRLDRIVNNYWPPWWRTTILVQSPNSLPISSVSGNDPHILQGYLQLALIEGLKIATTYLTSTNPITHEYTTATPTLISAPDGSHIISHL